MQYMRPILLSLLTNAVMAYLLPTPSGKYNVTLTTGPLVDHTRNDPYAATPTPRTLMLSIFQPATCKSTTPVQYMPDKTAEYQGPFLQKHFNVTANLTPLFLNARLPVCPDTHSTSLPLQDAPILLFSPGFGIPRFYYNVLASSIASEGFTVITIDHPEDANILVYPDGHAVYFNSSIVASPTLDEGPRAADASFVIDQLSNATAIAKLLPDRGARPFQTDRIGMLGHSLGGATAVVAASKDKRIRAAINWDGTIFGPLPSVSQPVMIMAHDNYSDPSWEKDWPVFEGPRLWVMVENATHETFSDVPTLLQASRESLKPYEELLGTIAPARMVEILTAYTASWMDGAFAGKQEAPPSYPEVVTVRKGNF